MDVLVNSYDCVSSIAEPIKHNWPIKLPTKVLKNDEPPIFQIQLANGHFEEATAAATLRFDIGGQNFAEQFVVTKILAKFSFEMKFLRHINIVSDTNHGLIFLPHFTMDVGSAESITSVKPQSLLSDDNLTDPSISTKTIATVVDHPLELHKLTEAANFLSFLFDVSYKSQKNSSQSNQHTLISVHDRKEHTISRICRSHSWAIHVRQINGHGNPQHDSGSWSGSDHVTERST